MREELWLRPWANFDPENQQVPRTVPDIFVGWPNLQNLDAAGAKALADSISAMDVSGCDVSLSFWSRAASSLERCLEYFAAAKCTSKQEDGTVWGHQRPHGDQITAGLRPALHATCRSGIMLGA